MVVCHRGTQAAILGMLRKRVNEAGLAYSTF
jgi:hypothetical protein